MWRSVAEWYRKWDEEQLAILARPELAAGLPEGYRRYFGERLARMTPVQRKQLHEFALKYRGARLCRALAQLALVFSLCGIASQFAVSGERWGAAVIVANAIGFSVTAVLVGAWFDYHRLSEEKWKLILKVAGLVLVGTVVGIAVAACQNGITPAALLARLPHLLSGFAVGILIVLVPFLAVSIFRNRSYEAMTLRLQQEAEQERLARELSESRLRLLRAQIEPHFLFNTLGAVQQLAQHGAPRAAVLTANLIAFLRGSMSDMRSEQVSLAAEFALVESYLKVMQVRLGERLRYTLALPASLEHVALPSMILLTLAENAIKHGIEPALRGGEVALSAQVDGGMLRIRVEDSGVGVGAMAQLSAGAGTGLDNVRHRLRLTCGDGAGLAFEAGDPGLVAEIAIPHGAASR